MYAVVWTAEAFDEMGRIVLLHAGRRSEITAALKNLTNRLARDPVGESESRAGEDRVPVAKPLTAYFRIVDFEGPAVEIGRIVLGR